MLNHISQNPMWCLQRFDDLSIQTDKLLRYLDAVFRYSFAVKVRPVLTAHLLTCFPLETNRPADPWNDPEAGGWCRAWWEAEEEVSWASAGAA